MTIRAAGGVLRKDGKVAIVHRARYDDWSLPKGKLEPGESVEAAALREVREETGFDARLGQRLGSTSYRDRRGRPKVVDYYEMTAERGAFRPGDEVDELKWVTPEEAARLLSYEAERSLLR